MAAQQQVDPVASGALKKLIAGPLPALVFSLLLLAALLMLSHAAQNTARLSDLYAPLLVINLIGIVVLFFVSLYNLIQLFRQVRKGIIGSRLTLRMVGMFALLAFLPLSVVYYISIQFLSHGIDSWFDVRIERAMEDAGLLGQVSLKSLKEGHIDTLLRYVPEVAATPDSLELINLLDQIRREEGYSETALFSQRGSILASSSMQPNSLVPYQPDPGVFSLLDGNGVYAEQETAPDGNRIFRLVVPVPSGTVGLPPHILQAIKPIPLRFANLEESINTAIGEYERLVYLRGPMKFGFILTLSLVSLMTLLLALWLATFSARRLVQPIRQLAIGTQAVADGKYDHQLKATSSDELGVLIKSFNRMTQQIALARENAQRSQQKLAAQHTYLETVLGNLSSGVLSFNRYGKLMTHNQSAINILGIEHDQQLLDTDLDKLPQQYPQLREFFLTLQETLHDNRADWQKEISLFASRGKQVLLCRGTRLPGATSEDDGYVFVFDDITKTIQNQRDAAWGEVARRLAHEIKNPLTPIQLSAERIRQKYLNRLTDDTQTLDRATRTIAEQVESMKEMVNAFSNYAQPVTMNLASVDLNQLLADVVELHRGHAGNVTIELDLDDKLPPIMLDSGRIRQVFNNLINNALQAMQSTDNGVLMLGTRLGDDKTDNLACITVSDNGPGIPHNLMDRLFEPYVTSKEKGTGLGLAIVKKIVDEHGGTIWASNAEQGGACFTIKLPLRTLSEYNQSKNDSKTETA
jgi:nitrogen fixation/metabolism regulation signal transduction histidine kinase